MFLTHTLFRLSFATAILAVPILIVPECDSVLAVVSLLAFSPEKTSYCMAALGTQTVTSTVTSTIPVTSTYTTITGTNTYTAAPVVVNKTMTTTVTTSILPTEPQPQKRQYTNSTTNSVSPTSDPTSTSLAIIVENRTRPVPKTTAAATTSLALSDYAMAAISTACGCITFATPSLTVTYVVNTTTTIQDPISTFAVTTVTPTTTLSFTETVSVVIYPTPSFPFKNHDPAPFFPAKGRIWD
jgi:hypothetical protein